ncbi:hypothetical protein [Streptomyces sp. NPDC002088]|uniref:hypothetical protein n=1 Tax=Streptomyces sp. NPDC002088 TaxID=3154665 RepID=UPI00332DC923
MDPVLVWMAVALAAMLIVAVAAVLVARFALSGTASEHRAAVLSAVAEIIRAIHGKR